MADRPNIVIFWGDDIGISNLSCYSDGLMGFRTLNIDRSRARGCGSPTRTASRAAPRGGRRSSRGRACLRRTRSSQDFLGTFLDYPPRMKAASFTIDQVQERLEAAIASGH